jgi:6-pyruvoyltetrahydropterin/6-carboxytetrahydropterin synthase
VPRATLSRTVRFAAAHRYRRSEWSDERNLEVFGACASPNYHGHGYECTVSVSGEVDPQTGFVVDLGKLDAILEREVRHRFDHRNINLDVPEFADGRLIPSGENLALFILERVAALLPPEVKVEWVRVAEDDTLAVTVTGDS